MTQFVILKTLLKMNLMAYNRGEIVDKAPASGATFRKGDPVKTKSPGGVNFLRKLSSGRKKVRRHDSNCTLETCNAEEEEDQPTPSTKKNRSPQATTIIKDTSIPLELQNYFLALISVPPGAFICRKSQGGSTGSKTNTTKKNVQAPLIFYQLILVDGNLVPEKIIYLSSESVHHS
jgi:hypothetical protein